MRSAASRLATRSVLVSRTGYTGEDGFEIVGGDDSIAQVWDAIARSRHSRSASNPAVSGARDTLRTEVCYPLYGHELDENTTPIEAGVGFFVALDKGDFIGRSVLAEQKASGVKKKCVAFKMTEKSAPPRPHYPIWVERRAGGRSRERHAKPVARHRHRHGLRAAGIREAGTRPSKLRFAANAAPAVIVPKPIYRKLGTDAAVAP